MRKKRMYVSLILFLVLAIASGPVLSTDASSLGEEVPFEIIDEQVWKEILDSPARETTFLVQLKPEGELSVDAQFRLEKMLDKFQETGGLRDYYSFYGRNVIKITGGAGILHFLSGWPELFRVSSVEKEEELRSEFQVADDLEIRVGTSQISGKVTAADGITPLSGIRVTAYLLNPPIDWVVADNLFTGAEGTYTMSGLAAGIYRVRFLDPSGNYVTEYYDNKNTFAQATNFDLGEGEIKSNINAALSSAGKISGTISLNSGGTEAGLVASAWSNASGSWNLVSNAITDGSGGYLIGGLAPGNYRVEFSDSSLYVPPRYVTEYYNNQTDIESAQDVAVTAGSTTLNINAALGTYGSVSGNVKAYDGTTNLANISVDVYRFDTTWEYFATGTTDTSGNYEVFGLGTENIRVGFFDPYDQFVSEFYNDELDLASADNIEVNLGATTPNINAQLALAPDTVNINLVSGWNLVSLPLLLDDNSTTSAFATISGNHEDIFSFEAYLAQPWKLYNPPIDEIISVSTELGYWIEMTAADTLSLTGGHPLETTIDLYEGWNLVGYPSVTSKPVGTVLNEISGKYSLVWQYKATDTADPWKAFNPSVPTSLNDLNNMEPGYGYWIYMTEDATLIVEGR